MFKSRKWSIFPRRQAGSLLENVIVGFVLTVVIVRLYLLLSPVTIVVVGGVHLAHMLYGGVLLSVASLIMLIYNNQQAARISSWLIGIGMGLFWDEVGKFISLDNDYYYRLALPIIYLLFLGLVSIWIIFRKNQKPTISDRMQQVWTGFHEGLLSSISDVEFESLQSELRIIRSSKPKGAYAKVVSTLEKLEDELKSRVVKEKKWGYRNWQTKLKKFTNRLLLLRIARIMVIVMVLLRLGWLGFLVLNIPLDRVLISGLAEAFGLGWLLVAMVIMYRDRHRGIRLAKTVLLLSIVFLGVFNFYLNQFEAILIVGFDIILYLIISEMYQLSKKV